MNPAVKNVLKAGAAFFAVGVLLTFAAPALASISGLTLAAGSGPLNAMWTGLYFGGFGALSAAISPMVDFLCGDKAAPATPAPSQININISQTPERAPAQDLTQDIGSTYQDAELARVSAGRNR